MEFLLKILYYGSGGVSALLVTFFFLAGIFGANTAETWVHKTIFLASGATALAMLGWSIRLGHMQASWVPGILLAAGALVAFAVISAGGMLLFTNVHFQ